MPHLQAGHVWKTGDFMRHMIAIFMLACCMAMAGAASARGIDLNAVAGDLAHAGDTLVAAYDGRRGEDTADGFSELYFGMFEASGMEAEIGAVDPNLKADLEAQFSAIIGLAYRGAPSQDVAAQWRTLRGNLQATAQAMSNRAGQDAVTVFLQSLMVLLREGGEAVVVVGALAAFLRRLGAERGVAMIWRGALAAMVASLLTAWGMSALLGAMGPVHEALEGTSLVLAAVMLAYVSHWLWFQHGSERWTSFLRIQASRALDHGRMFPLACAAFLAVYREGAETVLFYQVLLAGAEGREMVVAAGALAGAVCLGAVYLLYRVLPYRLPAPAFLAATAVPLFALSVVFAGQGIFALQGAGLLPVTSLNWGPRISWLGLFPTVESLGAQGVVLVSLVSLPLLLSRRRLKPADADPRT